MKLKKAMGVLLAALMIFCAVPTQIFTVYAEGISYVDAAGVAQTPLTSYTVVDENTKKFDGGWHVVTEDVEIFGRIKTNGAANLLLCNGATLTAHLGIDVSEGNGLTIWQQAEEEGVDTGALLIDNEGGNSSGIGGGYQRTCGTIIINGGVITAAGTSFCPAIGGGAECPTYGDITINGGIINATGYASGSAIGGGFYDGPGTITINGGKITAGGMSAAMAIGGGDHGYGGIITINGGEIDADSIGYFAKYTDDPDTVITLNWTEASARNTWIKCNEYTGKVRVLANFADDWGNLIEPGEFAGGFSYSDLIPYYFYKVTVLTDGNGQASAEAESYLRDTWVILSVSPNEGYRFKEWQLVEGKASEFDVGWFFLYNTDVTVKAIFEPDIKISKVKKDGNVRIYRWVGFEREYVDEAAEGEELEVELIENADPGEGKYFTGEFYLGENSLGSHTESGATLYVSDFKMPGNDIYVSAAKADRETLVIDLTSGEPVEITLDAFILFSRDVEMTAVEETWESLLDLDGSKTPDVIFTDVIEYDEKGNITDMYYKVRKLDSADARGRFDYTFTMNTDRYGTISVIMAMSVQTLLKGDVNGDNEVDSSDAALILKYDAGMIDFDDAQLAAGDVNGDNEVDSSDAALIIKYDAGIIDELN